MILLIYNPVSGKDSRDLDVMKDLFDRYGVEVHIVITQLNKTVNELLSTFNKMPSTIIIAGGDGTVYETINAVKKLELSSNILIYPRGTTNEYANSLGITKDNLEKFLKNNYEIKYIDIGCFNGEEYFIYSFVFGNFTDIPYQTPQWLKNKIGYFAYWLYAIVSLYIFRLKKYEMTIVTDDHCITGEFMFGSISNSHTLGKIITISDVSHSDGFMELLLISVPKKPKQIIQFLADIRNNTNRSGLFTIVKIDNIEVKSVKDNGWSADGEYAGSFNNIEVKVLKRDLQLVY